MAGRDVVDGPGRTAPATPTRRRLRSRSVTPALLLVLLLGLPPAAAVVPGGEGVEILAQEIPLLMVGEPVEVPLVLANRGATTWSAEAGFNLSYHWLDGDGRIVVQDGLRTPLPHPVPPGGEVEVGARLAMPPDPGTYGLQWDVVQEGVAWLSEVSAEPPSVVSVEVAPWRPQRAFTVLEADLRGLPLAGARLRARLEVRNDGRLAWPAGGAVRVAYHWRTSDGELVEWEGRRTPLPVSVAPGESAAVEARVELPSEPGRYLLEWDVVEEQVAWWSQADPTPQEPLAVRVVAWPPAGVLPALAAAALLALAVRARRRGRTWPPGADLLWLGASLLAKQATVLDVAGRQFSGGGLLVTLSVAALLLLALLGLPRRPRPVVTWAVGAAAAVLLLVDVVHLRYFGDVPSVAGAGAVGQAGWLGGSIRALLGARDLWLVADLVPAAALAALMVAPRVAPARRRRWAAALLLALALPGLVVVVGRLRQRPDSLEQVFQNLILVAENGPLAYHAIDAAVTVRDLVVRPELTPERLALVRSVLAERVPLRAGTGPLFGAAAGANLLMLQVESLQAFVVGLEVEGVEITPHLNRLRAQSLYLELHDQSGEGRTSDAELAAQASLLPLPSGAAVFRYPNTDYLGLADVLAAGGYTTLAAVPFEPGFWNRRTTYPAFGYAERLFAEAFAPGERIGWGLNDRDFLRQMLPRLERLERPFCAWLVTLSLHHPFEGFPAHLERLDLGPWEGTPFGAYLETMHLFDSALGELLAGLEASGLDRETVLVVYGDHDAGFGWERWLLPVLGIRHHHGDWYASDRVPLLVRMPAGVPTLPPVIVPAGQTDVPVTVAALLGVDPAPLAWIGRNLLGTPGGGPVVQPDGRWVDAGHLYAGGGRGLEDGTCFDLETLLAVPATECASGFAAAARQRRASQLLLTHDLQVELSAPAAR